MRRRVSKKASEKAKTNHQTGSLAETEFKFAWDRLGKRAYCQRLYDASDIFGLNRKNSKPPSSYIAYAQPSDFIVAYNGEIHYAEVKGTSNAKGFQPTRLEKAQKIGAMKTIAAGCKYFVYVLRVPTMTWYRIPGSQVLNAEGCMRWDDLKPFVWSKPQ